MKVGVDEVSARMRFLAEAAKVIGEPSAKIVFGPPGSKPAIRRKHWVSYFLKLRIPRLRRIVGGKRC